MNSFWQVFGGLIALVCLLIRIYKWGYRNGQKSYELSKNIRREELRLRRVYAPLREMLIDCHLTTVSLVKYPCFTTRWEKALPFLRQFNLKKFYKTLIDKGISTDTSVDYGDFDFSKVEKIVKNNIHLCDSKLILLLQKAVREQYEWLPLSQGKEILHKEDLDLINYIYKEYAKLSKKLVSK